LEGRRPQTQAPRHSNKVAMEYVHTVLAQIQATKADQADQLTNELEAHESVASTMRGFRGMRISRSAHPEGNVQLVVETRWESNNAMADYSSAKENASTIIEGHSDILVPDSLQVHRMESVSGERAEAPNRMYDRLALALFVPLGVLAFAAIVIYGMSRIYLALPAAGASIMAVIVALAILLLSWYFASNPRVPRWQWLAVAVVGFGALAIGGTVAAVYDEEHKEVHVPETPETPSDGGTPPPAGGPPPFIMTDNAFEQTSVTMPANQEFIIPAVNNGSAIHNVHVAVNGSFESDEPCEEGAPGCSDPDSIRGGQEGTITLNLAPGTYDFRCDFHIDEMFGTITAQ
jgi:heme-degrading monooxygenase HmoA